MNNQSHSPVHLGLVSHSVGPHYPYMVVALGNPHSTEGVRWEVQRPNGTLTSMRYSRPHFAEKLALLFKEIDRRKAKQASRRHGAGRMVHSALDCCPICRSVTP